MTYNNDERDRRMRHVPAPVFRRDPASEQQEFEDRALDTTLKVLVESKLDGDAFLQRVKAKTNRTQEVPTEMQPRSFFGFPESLYEKPKSHDKTTEPKIEAAANEESHYSKRSLISIVTVLATTASLLIGAVVWQLNFGAGANGNANSNAVAISPPVESADAGNKNFVAQSNNLSINDLPTTEGELIESELAASEPPDPNEVAVGEESSPSPEPERFENVALNAKPTPFFHLKLQLDDSNKGMVSIGESEIMADIPFEQCSAIIKCICHEVAKQVHFYTPILDTEWEGRITVAGSDFQLEKEFEGIDQMFEAGLMVRKQFQHRVSTAVLEQEKDADKKAFAAKQTEPDPIYDLVIKEVLSLTDDLLEDSLNPNTFRTSTSQRYKNFAQLRKRDLRLRNFEISGPTKRDASRPFRDVGAFRTRSSAELKAELKQAARFDIFDDSNEFRDWIRNGVFASEKRRISLEISRLNSQWVSLNKKSRRLASNLEAWKKLNDQKAQIFAQITNLREQKKTASSRVGVQSSATLYTLLPKKPELKGFDLAMGDACHLCDSDAETLNDVSKSFGSMLAEFDRFGSRNNPTRSNEARTKRVTGVIQSVVFHDNPNQAIGTIDQMLQIEQEDIRLELVKTLGRMDSSVACRLLACYAKYDLKPNVRVAATDALRSYPPEMCREELMEAFSYPWPDAARHAAEALVRLNDTEAIPQLVELLDRPDPRSPRVQQDGHFVRRELVAINHLRNCLLCHQDSHSEEDLGRGLVPSWSSPLPQAYYQGRHPQFARVRADVTYLRQDFSILRNVEEPGPWPENQRFDYVAWNRVISSEEADKFRFELASHPNEYRNSIDAALRALTDKSPLDNSTENWKAITAKYQ